MGTALAIALAALQLAAVAPSGAAEGRSRPAGAAKRPAEPPPVAAPAPTAPASALDPEPAAPPPAPVIGSVELHLSQNEDAADLKPLILLRPGAPLARKDVRRTLERLWGTGRFADIVVSASPDAQGRLAVVIEAESRTYVDRVDFEGHRALTEAALRKALALPDRRLEYYPEFAEELTARLRAAYRRIGYTHAAIDHVLLETEQKETVLGFRIREGEPARLVALHVAGDPQLPIAEIEKTLGLSPGDVLDQALLDKGLVALKERYRAEGHYRARFGAPRITEDEAGASLQLPVTASPAVEFRFEGNDAFSDAELKERLGYDPEEPLDATLEDQLADRLVLFYRLSGFADARVRTSEVRGTDRKRNFLVFHVEEGAPLRVVQVEFRGNRHFASSFLKDRLDESLVEAAAGAIPERARPDELLAGGPPRKRARYVPEPTAVYYEPAYDQALKRIVELYRADGFLAAQARAPLVSRDERTREARVAVELVEGPQTFVSDVSCPGAPDPAAACAGVPLRKGAPLNSLDVETSRQALEKALGRQGFAFARVEDQERFTEDGTQAEVSFRIVTGPKVRVGRILVQGLGDTAEAVVRGALAVEEGELLDPEKLLQSQRNLVRLGIFKAVALRMNAPEVPEETKDVFVAVDERDTQSVSFGAGYSIVDGPRLFLEYTKLNLFGRALLFSGRARLNYFNLGYIALSNTKLQREGLQALGRRINLALQYPRILQLLPVETGVRLDLVHELINRPAYDFMRSAAIVGADVEGSKGLSATLAAEIEGDDITRTAGATTIGLTRSDIEKLRFAEGSIGLFSLRPSVSWDLRDDPANPHRGILLYATTEFVTSFAGSLKQPDGTNRAPHSLFIKAIAQANGYLPLWGRVVLAVSFKAGKVFPLDSQSETILPKRFFLGGANSMRGFLDDGMVAEDQRQGLRDQVAQCDAILNKTGCSEKALAARGGETLLSEGGELFTLGRAELRFPIAGSLEGALFFDTGNLWLDQSQFDALRLRYAAGAGLRLVTPIGPAALDLGINLTPDRTLNEAVFIPHFSIGLF